LWWHGIACRLPPFSRSRTHKSAVLRVDVLDRHAERGADTGEGHEPDQRAVAQAGMRRDIDTVERRAG
jgi:hypothetical protein